MKKAISILVFCGSTIVLNAAWRCERRADGLQTSNGIYDDAEKKEAEFYCEGEMEYFYETPEQLQKRHEERAIRRAKIQERWDSERDVWLARWEAEKAS